MARRDSKTAAAQLRAKERAVKLERAAKKAASKFRPRKGDKTSFVFIGKDGKRLPSTSRKKGYLIYVNQLGKKKFVKDAREKKVSFQPKSFSGFQVTGLKHRKKAIKKFFAELTQTKTRTPRIIPTPGERLKGHGVDFKRIARNIGNDIKKTAAKTRGGKQFVVDVNFTVREKGTKNKISYSIRTAFKQQDLQKISKVGYENFVMKSIYAFLAEELSRDELVSGGSARFIRMLPGNKRKKKANWKKANGEPWEKTEFALVEIIRVEWNIQKVVIRADK